MGAAEIEAFLTSLAVQGKVAASTQNQALNALVFLYKEVLHLELGKFSAVRAKRPERLPVVLTQAETTKLLAAMKPGTIHLMARLLYGTGMRLMECVRLRVKDVLFEENQIVIRDGKGFKDRVTMLPSSVKAELEAHLQRARTARTQGRQHHADLHACDAEAGIGSEKSVGHLNAECGPRSAEWEKSR
jgi:site-specific recombinase XerD